MFNLPGHSSLSYNLNFSKVLSFDPFIKSVLMCSILCLVCLLVQGAKGLYYVPILLFFIL